ncbi:MAG TPA: DUF4388 domain-containing protein, partial [Burkholderiaceae bacterium]|nr:DUF4388 domain-containing protein [Burkholderiaceae bacterium]
RLQPQAVEEIRAHASRNQLSLLDALLAGGYLREADLAEQMQYELEEEVYDLFFCKDARFEFHENVNKLPEREGVVDERFFLNTESVIMEAARRIDEWSYISERITSGLEVFCPTDQPYDGGQGDHDTQSVYDHVDGRRNVARIVELTSLPSFAVFKSLCQLFDGGCVVQLPEKSVVPTGKACLAAGNTQDAINLFEKAIEQQIGIPQVHGLAAEAYQSVFEYESAVYHLQCSAEYKIAAHDYRGAAQQLKAATALVPTDLTSRDRLVEIALAHDLRSSDFDAVAAGKELVDLFLAAGELNRVRALLERLLHARPDDLDLKKLLVNVHTKAGDQARVIELYLSIADNLVADHKPLEAVGYLQKILMLDRSRSDVSERVRSLYTLDERTRSRRRTLIGLGVLSVLLFVLGLAYQWYDSRAVEDFEHIDVAAMLQAGEFEHAELEYQRFVTEHPFATVNSRANEALARIGGLRLKHEAELANQRAAHDLDIQKLRQDYRTEWRRHAELFKAGKAEESLAALERVAKLVHQSNQPEDHAWALEQGVENNLTRLRAFLDKATELRHRSEEELAAGHVDVARTLAIDLLTNYDIAAAAKGATIPVRFQSRPMGALILRGGAPLTATGAGGQQPLRTPALVMCGREPAEFTFQLDGFEPAVARVDARQQAVVDEPLVVIPDRRIRFAAPVSLLGIGSGHLVAGLRSGKVAIASLSGGQVLRLIDLGGLREMDGEPVVTGDRVFFSSNEGTLECWRLDNGRAPEGWPQKLASGVATEIVARDGRLVFVDRDGQVC